MFGSLSNESAPATIDLMVFSSFDHTLATGVSVATRSRRVRVQPSTQTRAVSYRVRLTAGGVEALSEFFTIQRPAVTVGVASTQLFVGRSTAIAVSSVAVDASLGFNLSLARSGGAAVAPLGVAFGPSFAWIPSEALPLNTSLVVRAASLADGVAGNSTAFVLRMPFVTCALTATQHYTGGPLAVDVRIK